jgi:hypothetical protein
VDYTSWAVVYPEENQIGVIEADYSSSLMRIRFKNTSGAAITGNIKFHATLLQG